MLKNIKRGEVTAIVKNFLRDEYLFKCVDSLIENYPDIKILIADDSYNNPEREISVNKKEFYKRVEEMGHEVFFLPFDSGLCVGRNFLINKVKTEFVLVGDDDFFYDEGSGIYRMVEFLKRNEDIDLVGGRVFEGGKFRDYQGFFDLSSGHFKFNKMKFGDFNVDNGFRYKECDLTFNFFVARSDKVKDVLWDEEIKVAYEHASFFIDFKLAGYKVVFTPDCRVVHKPPINVSRDNKNRYVEYREYRNRRNDRKRFFKKYKLNAITDMSGYTDVFEDSVLSDVTFIIKTFKRFGSLSKLLYSIADRYPQANVLIADDDEFFDAGRYKKLWNELLKRGLKNKPVAYNLPFDSGLSYCRNFLVDMCNTSYILLLDDDFVFDQNTNIEKFVEILDSDCGIGVVGGSLVQDGNNVHFEGNMEKVGRDLVLSENNDGFNVINGISYKIVDYVLNFALFRRSVFDDVRWDDKIKISGEHTDFYLRLKESDWKVAYCPDVTAIHEQVLDDEYKSYRKRDEFLKYMMDKNDIDRIIYPNKFCYEYDRKCDIINNYRVK